MKTRVIALFAGLMVSLPAWADINLEPLLNKVTIQFTANQWVTSKTALVNVAVNAAVTDQGIEQVQNNVLQKLNSLAAAEWHIMTFNRQQDTSGLEKIQIMAQARLQQTDLVNLRNKAKGLSKPGETYTIDSVQFTPSDDEIRDSNIQLRNNIYQQVKNEIDALNKIYPNQNYYLHQIDFAQTGPIMPMPVNEMYLKTAAVAAPAPRQLSVGNKVELQASAVLASMPGQVAMQLPPKP